MTWKPGQTGNPNGAPIRAKPFKAAVLKALESKTPAGLRKLDALAEQLIAAGLSGDMTAVKIIRDTVDGLPVQKIDITERDDGPFASLSDSEVERLVKETTPGGSAPEESAPEPDQLH